MKKFLQKSGAFIKKRKYYIAVSLCILTAGIIGIVSYQNAKQGWDDTRLPEQSTLDSKDAVVPKDDVTEQSETVSKPTKQKETEEKKTKAYILPVDGTPEVGYSADTPIYSKTLEDWRTHDGIDYTAPLGTKVVAINDGVISEVATDSLMGVTVKIKHTDGTVSTYSNLADEVSVKKDQLVSQGDTIGKVGQSAIIEISEEPHLHFSVSCDGKTIDPLTLYDK